MALPCEPRVRRDVDAIELAIRVEGAYMGPHVGALTKMMLAVRALESLRRPALVSVMSYHMTTVLVAATALRARMTIAVRVAVAAALQRSL